MLKGMRYTSRRAELCVAAALGLLALGVGTFAFAQNEAPGTRARQRTGTAAPPQAAGQPAAAPQGVTPGDHLLAAWLIVDNDAEINLAELAEKNAQNKDVKEFATKMAKEHEELVKKLERFGGPSNRRDRGAPGQQNARTRQQQPAQGTAPPAGTAPAAGGQTRTTARPVHPAGQIDVVALKQQLGDKCEQTARRELEKKSGAEFDRCYMEMQVFMHQQMIDALEVFATHASPELQKILEEAQKTTEEHLKHARELVKQVADSGSSKSNNRGKSND